MGGKADFLIPEQFDRLGIIPFKERFPWFGGDLQTLRDTFILEQLPFEKGQSIQIPVPGLPGRESCSGNLLAILDQPANGSPPRGLVLMLHGLGGSSRRSGLRRMAVALQDAGFAVLRLNLRGADPCRDLVGGTYAAQCNCDLLPVFRKARELCKELGNNINNLKRNLPLFGVGISLGGTILLNACLEKKSESGKSLLDGLVCTSSPLDLNSCSASIDRPRNKIYQRWILQRLVRQTLQDPFGLSNEEREKLQFGAGNGSNLSTIRAFDALITAPRWGYKDVDDYYSSASPFCKLFKSSGQLPPTLLLQADDDPWVPSNSARKLAESNALIKSLQLELVLTRSGGHNGFHGIDGCWGDRLVVSWLQELSFN